MNNILVTGAQGQLGSELKELSVQYDFYNFFFTDVHNLDICNHREVNAYIELNRINIIINCAAYTAVDKAETDCELANKINNLAVSNFAEIAKQKKIKLIHISTDYVFDGEHFKPYNETDLPNPQSVYGKTKYDGEMALIKINPKNSAIIRTSWVYSEYGNNFVKTMLQLGKERESLGIVSDQVGSPTNAKDLAKFILKNLSSFSNDNVEVYHFSNQGICSWYDFAKIIFETTKINILVNPISSNSYPTSAKRPFYSVLSKEKIMKTFKVEIPYWQDSLKECLNKISK